MIEPTRRTVVHDGDEREYFVRLPSNYDPARAYWALLAAHGGGEDGLDFWLAADLSAAAERAGLDTIVISPSYGHKDPFLESYPSLGGAAFTQRVLEDARQHYLLRERILLAGYSRGGQFAHRFALWFPDAVEACAALAAGAWTTPDGRLLYPGLGEIEDPGTFFSDPENRSRLHQEHRYMVNKRVAGAAGTKAHADSSRIPFLIMCGTLDVRYEAAPTFAERLSQQGYTVQTAWPETAHLDRDERPAEFAKYSQEVVRFFLATT